MSNKFDQKCEMQYIQLSNIIYTVFLNVFREKQMPVENCWSAILYACDETYSMKCVCMWKSPNSEYIFELV